MLIAVLPYGTPLDGGLHSVPTSRLRVMKGSLTGQQTVADLGTEDHLICYPDSRLVFRLHPRVGCRLSAIIAEPRAIHGKFYRAIRWSWRRYFRILTFDDHLLRKLPNALPLPVGTTWVDTDLHPTKTKHMSLIASEKRATDGHRLRHELVEWIRSRDLHVDVLGRGYKPLDRKSEGLGPYRFSVVIENSRQVGYFTEKLLDALFCDTVPIYWGDPDIGSIFDVRGMVICTDETGLRTAIQTVTETDYRSKMKHMAANRLTALRYLDYEMNAANLLTASLSQAIR